MKKKERLRQRKQFKVPPQPPVETEALFPPLSPEEHKEVLEGILANRPALEADIRVKIERCREIFLRYDPACLLTELADKWAFRTLDSVTNESFGGDGDAFLEYAIGVAAATPLPIPLEIPPPELIGELLELIPKIHHGVSHFHAFQHFGKDEESPGESVRSHQMISAVYQRGMRYEHHQIDLVKSIFKEHNAFFAAHLGMSAEEVVAVVNNLYSQPLKNRQQTQEFWLRAREVVDGMSNTDLNAKLSEAKTNDDVVALLRSLPEIQAAIPDFDALREIATQSISARGQYRSSAESAQNSESRVRRERHIYKA